MKVWFCRDDSGECSVWDGEYQKPVFIKDGEGVGGWEADVEDDTRKAIATDTEGTFRIFGKGFHDVRKGRCKLMDLEKVIQEGNTFEDIPESPAKDETGTERTVGWITYPRILQNLFFWWPWRKTFCRFGWHLFDEVDSCDRRYIHCDACGKTADIAPLPQDKK